MVRNIQTLLVAFMLVPSLLLAATYGPYTYTVTSGQATITDFDTSYVGVLEVTNQLGGCPVTAIGAFAFEDCHGMTSITIPAGVTSIAERAISTCMALTNISLPSSLVTLDVRAFYNNPILPDIAIPEGITTLPLYLCNYCWSLTKVSLPSTLTSIGEGAFDSCTNLPSIAIPAGVTSLGMYAFYGNTRLRNVYFAGPAPAVDSTAFQQSTSATVYYRPGTGVWGGTYAGRPTKLWNPDFSEVVFTNGVISCTVTGAPSIPVALDATTNLMAGAWTRLLTTNLAATALVLPDGTSSNLASRFYRVVGP